MNERPVRLLSRLGGEMHLSGIDALARLSPGVTEDGIVALVVLRVCLPDWVRNGGPARPVAPARATTVRALARSLGWPTATTHRSAVRLTEEGLLTRGTDGLFVSPAAADRVVPYLEEAHDLLLRFAEDVSAAGALPAPVRPGMPHPAGAVLATAMDMMLVPFETFRDRLGDWTAKKLWMATSTLSVRRITCDPDLSARYAVASTPDAERRAVPASQLRAVTRTSTATAWRRLRAMEAAGVLAQRDGGWLVRSNQLLEAEMEAGVRAGVDYYLRRLKELVAIGFDTARPFYLRGRPALVVPVQPIEHRGADKGGASRA